MRKFYFLISVCVVLGLTLVISKSYLQFRNSGEGDHEQEDIKGALEDHFFTSSDVDLGIIPYAKLFKAIDEGRRRLAEPSRSRSMPGSISNPYWRERGPNNRGGRTRAIMIDESDPNRNRIWIGGVSGGLWRTEDITQENPNWVKLGTYFESLSISDIAQDPNDLKTIYVSTGESYTGDVPGAGIFKSVDDGATWTLLPSTVNASLQTMNEIYVHTNGDIYAATSENGIVRSQDGGETWNKVLGVGMSGANSDDFHDFYFHEMNKTFYTSSDYSIYKSSTGNPDEWTNIGVGKPGFPNGISRVEFSMCPSDPNVLYMLGAVGSYSTKTIVSVDGGENWISKIEPN